MFEFYEFNNTNICIVLISTFIIYNYLTMGEKTEKSKSDIHNLVLSATISLLFNLIIAYIMSFEKEKIPDDNFWD